MGRGRLTEGEDPTGEGDVKLPRPSASETLSDIRRHLFRRKNIFSTSFFIIGGTAMILSAIGGDSDERLFLAIWAAAMTILLAVILALYSGLLDDALEMCSELMGLWKTDSDYAHDVTADYVRVLSELYEHDPVKAEYFRERLADYALVRHPDLAVWIQEQIDRAGWN